MLILLVLLPALVALIALVLPSEKARPYLIPVGAVLHTALLAWLIPGPTLVGADHWLVLDPLGKLILGTVSVLYLCCSLYAPGYLAAYSARPNRVFVTMMLVFLATMTLVVVSHHLGLMWVAMEATTLASAPLLFFNRHGKSLEATWKYLLICSVGIALALLGSLFLGYASFKAGLPSSLLFEDLLAQGPLLSKPWLRAAFAFLLVGYGTKMGLAPMHTWKPDAYGEAPGLVGALLAGGLSSCAFLAILRVARICGAAGVGEHARSAMVALGLTSMAFAAVFMVRQRDLKRMLAWSSVEHMGILVLGAGLGVGGAATFATLLHVMGNAFTKGVLFLAAANIHRSYGSKLVAEIAGVNRRLPVSGALLLAGFFAITGSPPFGPFVSQFTLLGQMVENGRHAVAAAFLLLLGLVFLGMGGSVLAVVQGKPSPLAGPMQEGTTPKEPAWSVAPPLALLGLVLMLGLYRPEPLDALVLQAAALLEVMR